MSTLIWIHSDQDLDIIPILIKIPHTSLPTRLCVLGRFAYINRIPVNVAAKVVAL
uniref:Uncharacterized protein n=1 Tax=Medicago truncatula TaxID=3880 RepID=A2Q476_MEDTR|nr:hypothetical protein MtrDRAFT_AC157373g17v2 [Medicago truncatula]